MVEETKEGVQIQTEPDIDYSIEQLEGVGTVTTKKLESFGVTSIFDICIRGSKEVSEITGVTKSKSDQWVFQCQKILEDNKLIRDTSMNTVALMEYQENYPLLSVKCEEIDNLLGGGLKPECLYEVYGAFGSGKTQFSLALTVEAVRAEKNVVWVDCEDTFRPKRLVEIMMAKGYVEDKEEAKEYLESLSKILQEKRPRLVVFDGAIGQFREEYLGRGTLSERQNQIARLMTHSSSNVR